MGDVHGVTLVYDKDDTWSCHITACEYINGTKAVSPISCRGPIMRHLGVRIARCTGYSCSQHEVHVGDAHQGFKTANPTSKAPAPEY